MDIISTLTYLGITPQSLTPLILVGLTGLVIVWKHTKPVRDSLQDIRERFVVVESRVGDLWKHKLDNGLIKAMSPYTIQPAGEEVLKESGFVEAFEENKGKFFEYVDKLEPKTKLEVENYSITSVSILLGGREKFLNPIQIYLYEHPNVRQTFPTLAGIYVRDKYFAENTNLI